MNTGAESAAEWPSSRGHAADGWRDESWFAALGLPESTQPPDVDVDTALAATAPGALRKASSFPEAPGALQRVYRMFSIARALLGAAMLVVQALLIASATAHGSMLVLATCASYAVATFYTAHRSGRADSVISPRGVLQRRWFVANVGVDLGVFSLLLLLIGPTLNVAALFALPVLMAAALTGRRTALAVAAGAALVLLAGASVEAVDGDLTVVFMQAGLAGAGLFAIAALTSELAVRLAREERAARSTLALARQQALLNRLVIEEMQDGVLVVDRTAHVRAANPAALALIGLAGKPRGGLFSLHQRHDWQPLARAVERGYAAGAWPDGGRDIVLRLDAKQAGDDTTDSAMGPATGPATGSFEERSLRLRMRFARRREREIGEALCVLFLEDVRTVRARARQEKLAAMGRVSAGIAHEIRNPLAAIAQANALMAEDLADAGLRRLAAIVADNVGRLRRIVDDVMAAAPGGSAESAVAIDLGSQVAAMCADWLRTSEQPVGKPGVVQGERVTPEVPPPLVLHVPDTVLPVRFDPEHLRRVLVNLLDNAWRHSSQRTGAVVVQVEASSAGPALFSVASDGEPIAPEVERHLFEPFFSTRSRGSGLGLYICRELCARYGASIDYRAQDEPARHHNVFVVSMPLLTVHEAVPTPVLMTTR
jgi:two-component system sensor histidine kinase PilS (NtrC family)